MTQTISPPAAPVVPENPAPASAEVMTFQDHLLELRWRFIVCVSALVLTTGVVFYYVTPLIRMLQSLTPPGTEFVQLTPGEVFLSSFKLSVFAGVGLSLPVILYNIFRFLSPGLELRERRMLFPMLVIALGLFCGGVLFGYKLILPMMLTFLLDFGQTVARNQLGIAAFLDFCNGFLFASGLIFQLPLCLLFASFLGLLTSRKLLAQWKWAIVASFLVGAVITPSADPFSQCVMAAALFGLYGLSAVMIRAFGR